MNHDKTGSRISENFLHKKRIKILGGAGLRYVKDTAIIFAHANISVKLKLCFKNFSI